MYRYGNAATARLNCWLCRENGILAGHQIAAPGVPGRGLAGFRTHRLAAPPNASQGLVGGENEGTEGVIRAVGRCAAEWVGVVADVSSHRWLGLPHRGVR